MREAVRSAWVALAVSDAHTGTARAAGARAHIHPCAARGTAIHRAGQTLPALWTAVSVLLGPDILGQDVGIGDIVALV